MAVKSDQPGFRFPLKCVCPDGRRLVVDHMEATDIARMYREVTNAAEEGQGYGLDEYGTESEFHAEVKNGHNFVFKDANSFKTIAWTSIYSGGFSRSVKLVTPHLVIAEPERGKHIAKFIGEFTVDYCAWCGFDGILCDFFTPHPAIKSTLISLGFKEAGALSICGRVKHHGYIGCEFMFYDLREDLKRRRSIPENGIYTAGVSFKSKL